jgi:hypothetical protein
MAMQDSAADNSNVLSFLLEYYCIRAVTVLGTPLFLIKISLLHVNH